MLGVAVALAAIAAPGTASAYIGESLVETAPGKAGDELTGPAKTILERPTFLPELAEEAAAADGPLEGQGVLSTFEGAGFLPELGGLVGAFGIGAGVGSAICNEVLELEGCWFYGSEEADPVPSGGTWEFHKTATKGTLVPQYSPSYVWEWSHNNAFFAGVGSVPTAKESACGLPYPFATASNYWASEESTGCGPEFGLVQRVMPYRTTLHNREFKGETKAEAVGQSHATGSIYCPEVGLGGTCGSKPNAEWAKNIPKMLHSEGTGVTQATQERIGEALGWAVSGGSVANPYRTYVEIPNCDGLVYAGCEELLEKRGLKPERKELNWTEVETDTPDEVVELEPDVAKKVEKGSKVKVITNPGKEGMPVVVPSPEPGETYEHYAARLNPGLTPKRVNLEAPYVDPHVGPNAVTAVSPRPETRFEPGSSHEVTVTTNPADAPVPSGGFVPPSIPPIDMSPLEGIPNACSVFPFGLFCWIGEGIEEFNVTGVCPSVMVPTGHLGDGEFQLGLCDPTAETVMEYVRPFLMLVFIVACGIMFARGTKAVGGEE